MRTVAKAVLCIALLLGGVAVAFAWNVNDGVYPEIHCKHFCHGYPTGTPTTNDMIIRDIYALSSNDEAKFADWVAYRLDEDTIEAIYGTRRNWKADPWLDEEETLEPRPDDYRGAHEALGTDRGHQASLASFKGTAYWPETNYYSNITPQDSDLNQGPWRVLEDKVRDLARTGNVVYVMTGPLYEYEEGDEIPELPEADETHTVPSGYWKIVAVQDGDGYDTIRTASFIFDQETHGDADVLDHLVTVDDVEERSGLDVMWELRDDIETEIEGAVFEEWAEESFK